MDFPSPFMKRLYSKSLTNSNKFFNIVNVVFTLLHAIQTTYCFLNGSYTVGKV
jgi:hypothetical protein